MGHFYILCYAFGQQSSVSAFGFYAGGGGGGGGGGGAWGNSDLFIHT